MKTGFYVHSELCVNKWLEQIKNPKWKNDLDDDEWCYDDAYIFLQGSCQLFAYALNEMYGYKIIVIQQKNNCHYFCEFTISNKTFYIDVRGITSELDEFMDGLVYISKYELDFKECKKEEPQNEGEQFGYDFAKYIIRTYPKYYNIICEKGD